MASSTQKESASFKIFVGGLDPETTEDDLADYFSKFGRVIERLIKVDIKTKRSRGFAFIGFKSAEAVDRVLGVETHRIRGKKIDCKRAMTKEDAYSLNKNLKESCRKVFVSNIPKEIQKKTLHDYFSDFGKIVDFNLIFKKKETGFLYIIFEQEEDALNLIERKFVEVNGFRLEIQKAVPKESKEGQEEEQQQRTVTTYHPNHGGHYRNSFESPFSYQSSSIFSTPNTPGIAVGSKHHPRHQQQHFYEPVCHGHQPNHPQEIISPFHRPIASPHPPIVAGEFDYYGNRIYTQPIPQFQPQPVDPFFERVPVRNRVRSEQTIQTIGPLFGQQPQFTTATELRQVPRSRTGVQSFSHADDPSFSLNFNAFKEQRAQHSTAFQDKLRPTAEFIENKMDFKSFKPNNPQKDLPSPKKKDAGLAKESEGRQSKHQKIKALEDEIKATKEKLKVLEEQLRQELATVEEGHSFKEGLSNSSNNE